MQRGDLLLTGDGLADAREWESDGYEYPAEILSLPDLMVARLLLASAFGHESLACPEKGCQDCLAFESDWDEACNRLPQHTRNALLRLMADIGTPYPGTER